MSTGSPTLSVTTPIFGDKMPISLAQRERLLLWWGNEYCLDQPTYAWIFPGRIDVEVVEVAWGRLLSRFGNLRARFVADSVDDIHRVDSALSGAIDATFVATDGGHFFDELCAPLTVLGGALTRMVHSIDGDETLIGVCFDHLVIDGHTLRMILSELWGLLRNESPAGPAPLSDEAFIRRERDAALSPAVERDLDYWRETSGGLTYPPFFADLERDPAVPAAPETSVTAVDLSGPADRARMSRAAALLAAVTASLARTTGTGSGHFTTLVQGARRTNRSELRMAGFLSTWLLAKVPVGATVDQASGALLRAMGAHSVHHAEIVRRLEPHHYGARYRRTEALPPYALFNFQGAAEPPRLAGGLGRVLTVPPVPGNVLHGGLRVYGTEREGLSLIHILAAAGS